MQAREPRRCRLALSKAKEDPMPDFSTLSITKDAFAELADCSFADSGRVLAARASVLRAGHVPGIDLFRGITLTREV